jgi:drug/metabolite transporter (DMT)-like permease
VIAAGACALGAATCFALCAVLQHRANHALEPREASLHPGLLLRLVQHPLFLLATVVEVIGLGLQTVSLGLGALAFVQPLLVSGLLIAAPMSALIDHRRLTTAEVAGAALTVVGLAAFLIAAHPGDGVSTVDVDRAIPVAALFGVIVVAAAVRAGQVPAQRGIWLGLASGLLYGLSSGLIKVVVQGFSDHGIAVALHWPLYALVLLGGTGVVLTQHAFAAGGLGAPLAVLTLAEPVAAVTVGAVVLRENLAGTPGAIAVQALGAVLAAIGVWWVSSSPGARLIVPA